MSSEYAIELADVGKCYQIYDKPSDRLRQMLTGQRHQYYRSFWALRNVDLKIRRGQTVGIIGKNGSGKSTLLQLICGTLNPTEGGIRVQGRVAALLELGAGFNPEFTGVENAYLVASLYGLNRTETDRRFDAIAAFADIGEHIHQPVKNYSSGMYVRLAFAVIANMDADVLIIDEALAVGDAFFVQKCMRFLREFKSRGTLLFVSHDMQSVLSLCSDAVLLESGKVLCAGSPKEVSERYLAQVHTESEVQVSVADTNDFGTGAAHVVAVTMTDLIGKDLIAIEGGESVRLNITCRSETRLNRMMVGFVVRDRLGQVMFGENTGLMGERTTVLERGESIRTYFEFRMPRLQRGKYSVSAAIGEGTQAEHVHHHWKNDALIFDCVSPHRCFGMISIEVTDVGFEQ